MAAASYRLRPRRRVDSSAAADALGRSAHRRRLVAPPCWSWSWPLSVGEGDLPPAPDAAWTGNVRAAAVADGGEALALVSASGVAILAALPRSAASRSAAAGGVSAGSKPSLLRIATLSADVSKLRDPDPEGAILFTHATSVAMFHVADQPSGAIDLVVAVGYSSGAVAFFDAASAALCAVTRPVFGQPVRRLRYVPAFHMLDPSSPPGASEYPYPSPNSGLFCVFGWSGTVGRLPTAAILDAIASQRCDSQGARWILWRLQSQDAVVDAVPCASEPSPVCEMDSRPVDAALRVVATGVSPPIAAFACASRSAFSARDAARKAATAVFSAAKGAVYSRLSSFVPRFAFGSSVGDPNLGAIEGPPEKARGPVPPAAAAAASAAAAVSALDSDDEKDDGKPVSAVVRASLSWTDEPDASSSLLRFGFQDVSDAARKSISSRLARRHARSLASRFGSPVESEANTDDMRAHDEWRRLGRGDSTLPSAAASVASALPQNARLVSRCISSPVPCTLFATMDTLGRVLVLDARDLCVLRVFKGYRDAHCAWLSRDVPTLAILSPRRAVLELHAPLEVKRAVSFNVEPGTLLLQSTTHSVFCFSPSGVLYELSQSRKIADRASASSRKKAGEAKDELETANAIILEDDVDGSDLATGPNVSTDGDLLSLSAPPTSDTVSKFQQFCQSGQTSQAVEVLDNVSRENIQQVAHLMSLLVCTASYVRPEVHVAVASKAARIATDLGDADLAIRFEAHSHLGEAAGLLAAEVMPGVLSVSGNSGPRLGSEESFAFLLREPSVDVSVSDTTPEAQRESRFEGENGAGRKGSSTSSKVNLVLQENELVNCERFILAHAIVPCDADLGPVARDYAIRPREDLSESERIWVSRSYFARLVASDENDLVRGGDPEPTSCRDVFLAIRNVLGYGVEETVDFFLQFFLNSPIEVLLATPLNFQQSGLRCALERLRAPPNRNPVDEMILDACEHTTNISNATLLVRLCIAHEGHELSDLCAEFTTLLVQLTQAVELRHYVATSTAASSVVSEMTARIFEGVPSESERKAIHILSQFKEEMKAASILQQLSSKIPRLEWHEAASVSEVALQAGRQRLSGIFNEAAYKEIAPNIASWIKGQSNLHSSNVAAEREDVGQPSNEGLDSVIDKAEELMGIQAMLIAAHDHFPATSIDTVRCLQLAEAVNVILASKSMEPADVMSDE